MDETADATQAPGADETARFQLLQARLPELWRTIRSRSDFEHTSVVVPSLSVDQEELRKVEGASFYEERLLFSIARLRHPRARVVYVTSQPIHADIVDYYLHLLAGVPASHARRRLWLVCVHDSSEEPLSAKLLRRPRLIHRLREWIEDLDTAYLTTYNSTPLERSLAVALGIPLNGLDPDLLHWGTKSGSREVFAAAGVAAPAGAESVRSEAQIVDVLLRLAARRPATARAVLKYDAGFSGEGNAVFTFPAALPDEEGARRAAIAAALDDLEFAAPDETRARYLAKFAAGGGIVEEMIAGTELRSPSAQMRVTPDGEVQVVSTHEQVLGGANGQVYVGCRFPADEAYRTTLQDAAMRVGEVLRERRVMSRFGVDFVVSRNPGSPWRCHAIEINLRMCGTTHPFMALEFLTGGALDTASGLFRCAGTARYYFSSDNLKSPAYRGLLPEDLMDILLGNALGFSSATRTGVLFHMIGALSQYGKLGVTCIGTTPEEAEELYRRTLEVLDAETGASASSGGRPTPLLDRRATTME